MRTLDAIASEASAAGYSLNLIPLRTATQSSVSGAFARLNEEAVDGIIIVIEAHRLADSEIELPAELPVVVIDSDDRYHYPVVDTDQAQGARLATTHLLDLGHTTVWHVAGPEGSYSAHRRRASWERTLRDRGAAVPEVIIGDWSAESGYRAGAAVGAAERRHRDLRRQRSDGARHPARAPRGGTARPGRRRVVGFDDMAESAEFWPPLTTVRQHFDQVGALALRNLVATLERHPIESTKLVETELVVRSSTAAPPSADV